MKRNCNLELRLSNSPNQVTLNQQQQQQQLTIFYNGQICVSDATEIQARAILWLASRQMDQERYNGSGYVDPISPSSNLLYSPLSSPSSSSSSSSSSSMKRSLQSFLQKRKHRQIANSPYHKGDRSS